MLTKYTTTFLFPFLSDLWGDKADEEMQRSVFENMDLRVFHSIMKQNKIFFLKLQKKNQARIFCPIFVFKM